MKNFVKFVQNLNQDRYIRLVNRVIDEKIRCAFFMPGFDTKTQLNFLNQVQSLEFNIEYFFTNDNAENLVTPPPRTIHVKNIDQLQIKPEYVLSIGGVANYFTPQFKKFGIQQLGIMLNDSNTDNIFNFYTDHLEDIFEVYQLLDEVSQKIFCSYILARVSNRFSDFIFDTMPQYLLTGYLPQPNDVVICAGACDGATAGMFADLGCRVYAFEMDKINYELSKILSAEKNFTLENLGLGSHRHEVDYLHETSHIGGSHLVRDGSGNAKTEIISLDEYVREKHLSSVDFIELDTEGEELEILKGSAVSIARFKPKLAISAYHKREDIFVLAQFIKSIRPDYEFAFRHYGLDATVGSNRDNSALRQFFEANELPPLIYSECENVLYAR